MFSSKQDVLFIEKSTITLYRVALGNHSIAQKIIALDWTPETIVGVLQKLRKTAKQKIRILLSDEFVYILPVHIPASEGLQQSVIQRHAQEFIPENLSSIVWSYKQVTRVLKKEATEVPQTTVHIVAYTQLATFILYSAFAKTNFHIELTESVSQSLGRLVKAPTKTFLVIYIQQKSLLMVSERGIVLTSVLVNQVLSKEFIENYIDSLQKSHSTQPDTIIFVGQQPAFSLEEQQIKKIPVVFKMLDPIVTVASQKDLTKKGAEETTVVYPQPVSSQTNEITRQEIPQTTELESKGKNDASQKKTVITIAVIIILLVSLVGWYFVQERSKANTAKETKKESTTATPAPTITPTPTVSSQETASPSAELVSSHSIHILNGSGREGEATKLRDILTEKGYTITNVGNSEGDLLEQTEVRFKESVDESVKLTLDKELENLYSFNVGSFIESDNEADIIITIGQE